MSKLIVDSCVYINAFKVDSEFHSDCVAFLERLLDEGKIITMPAHGWFEVVCSLRRIAQEGRSFSGAPIAGRRQYPIELIHIDESFVSKYGNIDIPRLKAGDHIFTVVAYVNGYQLVTTDNAMIAAAKELGITVWTPRGYLTQSKRSA